MEPVALHPAIAKRNLLAIAFALVSVMSWILLASSAQADSQVGIRVGHQRFSKRVRSLAELRWNNLTRQGWDLSCGAAALSTLLTYHHHRNFSELAVTLTILKNTDPDVVRARGGFSLYDLKRFVQAIGLKGVGYGDMTVEDLRRFGMPAILPIRIRDLDHFVIFRKRMGNHILLGDPAFGNISLPLAKFQKLWKSRIAFYVVTEREKAMFSQTEVMRNKSPLSPTLMESAIPSFQYGARIINRIPMTPMTRRSTIVTP